jgi:hypothetical protein
MLERVSRELGGLPIPAVIALLALAVVQIAVQIYALLDLARRPLVTGGRKWVWALVSVFGGIIGAGAYLAVGRVTAAPASLAERAGSEDARNQAIDRLYGGDRK